MHTIKEADMLAAKMDLLLKKLDEGNKQQLFAPVHAQGMVMVDTQGMTAPRPLKK